MSTSKDKYTITLEKAWSLSKEWKRAAIIWRTLDHFFVLGSFGFSMATVYLAAEVENTVHPYSYSNEKCAENR